MNGFGGRSDAHRRAAQYLRRHLQPGVRPPQRDPDYILDVFQQHIRIGQPIILYRSSNNDPAEDFRLEFQGTVADFYAAGMVSAALALHYGCIPGASAPRDR